ncbi:reverse transcriptase [Phytophthora megakarya]|uniref:Reverse transcriptase n=1 Tax=Phytophthora megakarya TaxID=4795 RepID=A0A225WYJ0_9STRA|nr:reverse transcriptase [Phytophthora megakarya]
MIADPFPTEIRFTVAPADHPVIVTLRGSEDTEGIISTSSSGPTSHQQVSSLGELSRALTRFLRPDVVVQSVHPHPMLSRLVCLWVGRKRWSRIRRAYKDYVATTANNRGAEKLTQVRKKWDAHSGEAQQGLEQLEWKRIRRVVGLNTWGEQLRFRLKHYAFSLFDITQNVWGCPHAACRGVRSVKLYHVFWEYP